MRHTFTPQSQRAILDHEYRARAVSTLFLALASAVLIGSVTLFPIFIHVSVTEQSALDSIAVNKAASSTDAEAIQGDLSAANNLIKLLSAFNATPRLSDAIRQISSVRSNIALSSISVDREGTSSISAVIEGTAPTRDELISFKTRLEGLAPGATVDLPIDELAKSSDIDFSIRLVAQLP